LKIRFKLALPGFVETLSMLSDRRNALDHVGIGLQARGGRPLRPARRIGFDRPDHTSDDSGCQQRWGLQEMCDGGSDGIGPYTTADETSTRSTRTAISFPLAIEPLTQ
jgi:hypothetical protein